MYANGAFKNPFADFDFTKFAGEFKFPMVNVETVVETGRKNFAAMTTASTAAVESFKTIAQRQSDMLRAAMEDLSKHGSDVLSAPPPSRRRPPSRSTSPRRATTLAIANTKELADLYTKGHADAFETLNARVAELTEEVKAAFAQEVRPNGASRRTAKRGCLKGQPLLFVSSTVPP